MKLLRTRVNLPEVTGALAVMAIGLYAIFEASGYRLGTLVRMGPGYFPLSLGVLLLLLGAVLTFHAWRSPHRPAPPKLRGGACVVGGVLAYAALISPAGIVPATFALVLISALGEPPFRPITALSVATGLSIFAIVVFIWGLGLPLKIIWAV